MAETITARADQPGCLLLSNIAAITIHHFPGDGSARRALQVQRLIWPEKPGALTGTDPFVAWRSPREVIALGRESQRLNSLLQTLAPGQSPTAMAADLSDAIAVHELHGPGIDVWLTHLVDSAAIPREAGQVTRCRLADAAVMLLRLETRRLWLLADEPISPYIRDWLAYAYRGAFAVSNRIT